ncbi:complement C2 [Emydura macquarii macquarii]|uniref:complement C2 n=1 Tax=Emydura macquarii macquarii TaxID=1129001 RepID=UPI00352BA91A
MAPSFCALLLLALAPGAWGQPPEEAAPSCGQDVAIRNGQFTLSDGYRPGSVLTYSCPPGCYPYPVSSRLCQANGRWTSLRSPSGKIYSRPLCKEMHCPTQLEFENGSFWPRLAVYVVDSVLTFECLDGYTLRGPAQRVCQRNGRWDGGIPACDDGAEDCPNPGVPAGATKTGNRYRLGDRVSYQCKEGLALVGSSQRVCTEAGEWSGAQPSCRAPFSYDRVEDVGAEFGASFSNVLGLAAVSASSSLNTSIIKSSFLGRRLIVSNDSFLNVYLLVDSSKSVSKESFQLFKEWVESIVDRVASFEVDSNFAVISYATQPKRIIAIYDHEASDADEVIRLTKTRMNFQDHGNGTGTNIRAALMEVYNMILFQKESFVQQRKPDAWKKIRHAIIVLTDGKYNTGGSPKDAVAKIEDVLEIKPNRKDYLDIYAFGIGTQEVDWDGLNEIASKKEGERHAFKMNSSEVLKAAFEDVLDPKSIGNLCGLGNNSLVATAEQQHPWHVVIKAMKGESCRGSLVSDRWVLTAAHCFNEVADTSLWRVQVGPVDIAISQQLSHPAYDVQAKAGQGIPEFYDYDVALVRLQQPVQFSGRVRPICLPCTRAANRALKKPPGSTCKDHERALLGLEQVPAHFLSLERRRLNVQIKTNKSRPSCIAGAIQPGMIYANVSRVADVVTDRFLCTGQEPNGPLEEPACKGESGGSLFLEKRRRYFQVGVVSWGTYNPCARKQKKSEGSMGRDPPPRGHTPRDFYLSLFGVQAWLRQQLGGSLDFLPEQ